MHCTDAGPNVFGTLHTSPEENVIDCLACGEIPRTDNESAVDIAAIIYQHRIQKIRAAPMINPCEINHGIPGSRRYPENSIGNKSEALPLNENSGTATGESASASRIRRSVNSCCSTSRRFGNRNTHSPFTSNAVLSYPSPRYSTRTGTSCGNCEATILATRFGSI